MIKPFDVTVLSGAGKHFSGESDLVVSDFQREIADILWKVSYAGNIVRKDGIIFADNILYKGYVMSDYNKHKQRTAVRNLREYIKQVSENPNLETEILEVGDGLAVSKIK